MDEQTLRRILGEFAGGITSTLERTNREISRVLVEIEGRGQRLDRVEKRLDRVEENLGHISQRLNGIERQLSYMKIKLFEHDEEIFFLRGSST